MPLRTLLLLIILVGSMPICFFKPFFGVIMWTIISFASVHRYAWGVKDYFGSAELVAIPTLLGCFVYARGWRQLASREALLIFSMWVWFTITTIVSTNTPLFFPHAEQTWARWEFVSKILLMTLITMAIVDSFERLRKLVIVTVLCFSFYVVKAIPFMILTAGQYRLYGPPRSMVEDNNDLALALNMTLPMLFFLAHTETNKKMKWAAGGLFFAVILGVFCTYSRGGLVGLAAVLGIMIVQWKRRAVLIPAVLLGGLVAIAFAPAKWKDRMDFTNEETLMDKSAQSRINAWTFSWNLANDYPITGGGFDTFTYDLFKRYAPDATDIHGPHSVYFGVLAEHGFVGLALYLALVVSAFASTGRVIREARRYGDDVAAAYGNMFRFSLVGFLVSGVFLGRAYFDYYFAIVCFIAILKRVCASRWQSEDFTADDHSGEHEAAEYAELEYSR